MKVFAIDPGNIESAYVLIDFEYRPLKFGKVDNKELRVIICETLTEESLKGIKGEHIYPSIEMVGHYGTGMAAGKSVFDTCIWIGRFIETIGAEPELIKRKTVVAHICGSVKASDSNVTQALIDRFAHGVSNHGKGSKKEPGFFHGFYKDIWQAYALAVTFLDKLKEGEINGLK